MSTVRVLTTDRSDRGREEKSESRGIGRT